MKKFRFLALAAACPLMLAVSAMAEDKPVVDRYASVPPEVATQGLTPMANQEQQANLAHWLSTERPAGVLDAGIVVRITPEEMRSIEEPEVVNAAPLKAGVVVSLDAPLTINGLVNPKTGLPTRDTALAGGVLTRARDGSYVWAVTVTSEGAGGIRLHLENVFLSDKAELYFYSEHGEAYGPYVGTGPDNNGDFWTPSVFGQTGTLQLRVSAPLTTDDLINISLRLTEVGHISRAAMGIAAEGSVASFCSFNASCIVNNNCTSNSAVNDAELAVAKMIWVQGAFLYICSGGLIADSDPNTQIPYFMTANHCLSSNSSNLECFFRYQVSCGTSNCPGSFADPPNELIAGKTVGATIKATGAISSGDYSLFQLSQNPPAGSVFLGWNSSPVAFTNGAALHRVSHPEGAPQAYSNANVDTGAVTCQGWNRGPLIYSRGNVGATEGGSSGSPVVNASGQFVGQLTGSCGFNLNDVCDHASNATVDGAFAFYFSAVDDFLAGGGGCVPTTEDCNDGVDNDCDSAIDCADSDCTGDPACSGGCAPLGAPCSVNADCCSNKCRGRSGSKTCR